MVLGDDTALYHVTEAYDMNGFTPRFNLSESFGSEVSQHCY